MRIRRLLWCLALVPFFAVSWFVRAAKVEPPPQGPAAAGGTAPHFELVGTASCAGRACHGSIEPLGDGRVRQNEFTLWVANDRHADAYRALELPLSQQIEQRLHPAAGATKARPQDDSLCLSCHVFPGIAGRLHSRPDVDAAFIRDFDGVGCENCHGPAEKWLRPHALPGWAQKTPAEKAALGMRPLATPTERAQQCVVCHVGSAEADMNHDLIAAGHPRLNFEFSAFYANMPRHWAESDADRKPAALIRSWAEGQVVTARAALELTAVRATPSHPWPEFAEYDCFACHHDLHAPSWRQQRGFGKHLPGTPFPNTWYLSMPRAMAQTQKLDPVAAALDKLQGLMSVPYPNRKAVAAQAKAAAGQLDALQKQVAGLSSDRDAARKWFATLADQERRGGLSWDEAAQLYLALAAYDQAYAGAGDKKTHEAVEALYKRLAFPRSQNSPGKDASAEHFKSALKDLDALLKAP